MNILIISPQLPYPLIDGAKKGVFYPIKYLAERGHGIRLACLSEVRDDQAIRALEEFCTVDVVQRSKRPTIRGALCSLFSSTPYDLKRFHSAELLSKIENLMETISFDVVQVEGIHAAYYGLKLVRRSSVPIVMRVHNVHYLNLQRFISQFKNPLKRLYLMLESRKVRRYEAKRCEKFACNLTVSYQDQCVLTSLNPNIRCRVVPAGVDFMEFDPNGISMCDEENRSVLWIGALGWQPNVDSFWWFYREIIPRIVEKMPEVVVSVVGSNPPKDILLIKNPNLRVLGFVGDVREPLARSQVCVVPLRVGSGIRLKLLEMFAMRKAVVSTTVGCEGLNVEHGRQLLIADQPGEFASAVVRLLLDRTLREEIGREAMQHARDHFSWNKIAEQYELVYSTVVRH